MSSNKLGIAKTLIQQKKYAEAREILESVNHPTATKWLAKLNEIAPVPAITDTQQAISEKKNNTPWLGIFNITVSVILISLVIWQQWQIKNIKSNAEGLVSVVNTHAAILNDYGTDINSLSNTLSNVSSLARNANNYAHSHNSYSDAALKTNITEIDTPLDRILSLRGVSFTWNHTAYPDLNLETGHDYGVLAQELAIVFPELVTPDTNTGLLRVDYDGLIPILIEAIREQQYEIDVLQTTLAEMNNPE